MNKIGIALLGGLLFIGTSAFILFNNQAHCAQDHSCTQTSQDYTWIITNYSPEALQTAFKEGKTVALYFQANWCGNCKLLEDELLVKGIPANATLLTVDFDEAQELRQRYEVTNLHTIVLIDHNMQMLHKDSSGDYHTIVQLLES